MNGVEFDVYVYDALTDVFEEVIPNVSAEQWLSVAKGLHVKGHTVRVADSFDGVLVCTFLSNLR